MKVLELFAGTKGWSQAFAERGHDVFSVELDTDFAGIDLYRDIMDLKPSDIPWKPDVILASPPCTTFSMMSCAKHWTPDGRPRTGAARTGRDLVLKTLALVTVLDPTYWVLENPRARLRSLGLLDGVERRTIWQCRYGRPYAKPTDLWGVFPPSMVMEPECWNGNPDHTPAERGSKSGVQGHGWRTLPTEFGASHWSTSPERKLARIAVAAIPYALSEAFCAAAERGGSAMREQMRLWSIAPRSMQ